MPAVARLLAVGKTVREGERERAILTDVDLEIATGGFVAVLGPSGSGKSTLLHLLAGIDVPTTGRVEVLGHDLGRLDETARTRFRRRHVGLVFQRFHLLPTLTVAENVLLPLDLDGRADARARDRVRALAARVGLEDRLDAFPDVLSGGEQQRVALARAVVARPQLLLADEPTGSLDDDNTALVLALLAELQQDEGCTIVMATHDEDAAARCDRRIRLHDGRLVHPSSEPARA